MSIAKENNRTGKPTKPVSKPRNRRRKEARPGEILDAAMAVFIERGFNATRMEDVAAKAKIGKGTLYLYYRSKQELLLGVVRSQLLPSIEVIEEARTAETSSLEAGSGKELISSAINAFYQEFVSSQSKLQILRLLISEGNEFPEIRQLWLSEIVLRLHSAIIVALRRGVELGEFPELVLQWDIGVITGPAFAASIWLLVFEDVSALNIERFIEQHVEMLLRALEVSRTGLGGP